MAEAIVLLSSSPSPPVRPPSPSPPPQPTTTTTESSSPGLPSPSSFFTKPPISQATGFTTAASAIRSKHSRATGNGPVADEGPAEMLPKIVKKAAILPRKSRKPLAKSASFILNSDDLASTQFAGLDATQVQGKKTDSAAIHIENAPTEKPKRAPRKAKKQDGQSEKPAKKTAKESAHFAKQPAPADDSATNVGVEEPIQRAGTPVQAHRRRLSWTPARNTTPAPARPATPASVKSNNEERPTLSLTAVLGELAYAKQDTNALQRSASGEALLKRRRIELADEATAAPRAPKPVKSAEVEPKEKVTKPKLPKKKPQTITEIATKAYRPEYVPAAAQATVSSFFAARGEDIDKVAPALEVDETAVRPKKPRKPREKKTGDDAKAEKTKKAVKPRAKAKVRFNEDDLFDELYEPEQARLQERKQDFLFGTSSQLGTRESPTFIRQMQTAIHESEAMSKADPTVSPSRKSYIRVPSAPHGTSLSCGQAVRELWCSAARDHEQDILAAEAEPHSKKLSPQYAPHGQTDDLATTVQADPTKSQGVETCAPRALTDTALPLSLAKEQLPREYDLVDLSLTSPAAAVGDTDQTADPDLQEELPTDFASPRVVEKTAHASHIASDDWMMLRSADSSPEVPLSKRPSVQVPALKTVPQLRRSATSPVRDRSVLQALDANVSLRMHTSPHKAFLQKPRFSTRAPLQKRSGSQPKKIHDAGLDETRQLSPKRLHLASVHAESQSVPEAHRPSPSKIFSASQPITSSDFVNIEDISDSEHLNTPSPRRPRATSTPPTLRTLDLEVVASPSVKARAKSKKAEPKDTTIPALAWSKLNAVDATWTAVMPTLFSQITAKVKSTAPSNGMAKPTWYEKILLYDPIVLEDLTSWLNDEGLRIETQKVRVKPKVKARKKKKDAQRELELVDEVVAMDEYETVQELLNPWMVQKWCEDNSVCCLWKEGLRGGVRTRY